MTDDGRQDVHLPGCERPAVPPHPLGWTATAFCDLEEHNALSAHQERQRLAGDAQQNLQRTPATATDDHAPATRRSNRG